MSITEMTVDGQQIRFLASFDDDISRCHKQGKFYEAEELALIQQNYTHGTILDIGANIGNHAVFLAKFTNTPRVIVFEANQTVIPTLKENLRLNGCANVNTQYLGLALAAKPGQMMQHSPEPHNLGYTFYTESSTGTVRSIDGDALLYDEPIGFAKIDVEGMEVDVLTGMQRTIQRWRPMMLMEVWDTEAVRTVDWLEREGYDIVKRMRRYDRMYNYLVKPRDR